MISFHASSACIEKGKPFLETHAFSIIFITHYILAVLQDLPYLEVVVVVIRHPRFYGLRREGNLAFPRRLSTDYARSFRAAIIATLNDLESDKSRSVSLRRGVIFPFV